MAYQGGGKCTSFTISKSRDRTEHKKDEDKSTFDYKINENETVSNDNQDKEIYKTEKDEKHGNSKVIQIVPK